MPINNKQRAFINEYLINGHNASKAYKKAYPDCNGGWERLGHRLMINDDIKAEIDKRMAKLARETGFTIEKAQQMYEEDRLFAKTVNQAGAAVSATTGICRLYGMDKDAGGSQDAPKSIPPEDLEELKAFAKAYTESKLAKPRLAKDIA